MAHASRRRPRPPKPPPPTPLPPDAASDAAAAAGRLHDFTNKRRGTTLARVGWGNRKSGTFGRARGATVAPRSSLLCCHRATGPSGRNNAQIMLSVAVCLISLHWTWGHTIRNEEVAETPARCSGQGSAKTTPVGFEPTRGDPIGLAGRRLSHSAKVSPGVFRRLREW